MTIVEDRMPTHDTTEDRPGRIRAARSVVGVDPEALLERLDIASDIRAAEIGCGLDGLPPIGIHLLMRGALKKEIRNDRTYVKAGSLAPVDRTHASWSRRGP